MIISLPLMRFKRVSVGVDFRRQNLTSESDVYRRQILTSKFDSRAEKVKYLYGRLPIT